MTHSLSFLSQVDEIVLLNEGMIEERGTYRELLHNKAGFSQMLMEHLCEQEETGDQGM